MRRPTEHLSAAEIAAVEKIDADLADLSPAQITCVLEHVNAVHTQNELPNFARGIAGPLGKLEHPVKTKIDEHTHALFLQHCAIRRTDTANVLRDCIYALVHGKTYGQMVVEKITHEAKFAESLMKLIGPFGDPESMGAGR